MGISYSYNVVQYVCDSPSLSAVVCSVLCHYCCGEIEFSQFFFCVRGIQSKQPTDGSPPTPSIHTAHFFLQVHSFWCYKFYGFNNNNYAEFFCHCIRHWPRCLLACCYPCKTLITFCFCSRRGGGWFCLLIYIYQPATVTQSWLFNYLFFIRFVFVTMTSDRLLYLHGYIYIV